MKDAHVLGKASRRHGQNRLAEPAQSRDDPLGRTNIDNSPGVTAAVFTTFGSERSMPGSGDVACRRDASSCFRYRLLAQLAIAAQRTAGFHATRVADAWPPRAGYRHDTRIRSGTVGTRQSFVPHPCSATRIVAGSLPFSSVTAVPGRGRGAAVAAAFAREVDTPTAPVEEGGRPTSRLDGWKHGCRRELDLLRLVAERPEVDALTACLRVA